MQFLSRKTTSFGSMLVLLALCVLLACGKADPASHVVVSSDRTFWSDVRVTEWAVVLIRLSLPRHNLS